MEQGQTLQAHEIQELCKHYRKKVAGEWAVLCLENQAELPLQEVFVMLEPVKTSPRQTPTTDLAEREEHRPQFPQPRDYYDYYIPGGPAFVIKLGSLWK